jgi:hypothetical protein
MARRELLRETAARRFQQQNSLTRKPACSIARCRMNGRHLNDVMRLLSDACQDIRCVDT